MKRAVRIQTQQATPKPGASGWLARFSRGRCSGRIDAAVIGAASRDSVRHFAAWADIGDENELFQNFKYLWHFVVAYGEAAEAPPEISPFKKHPQVL